MCQEHHSSIHNTTINMGQQRVLIMTLLLASNYVACNAKSLASMGYQADWTTGLKTHQPHKRYQNSEPSEYNTLEGKVLDDSDIFDELPADVYEQLKSLIKDMQKGRARLSIRYKPYMGKRAQLY